MSAHEHTTASTPSDFETLIAPGLSRRRFLGGMGLASLGAFFANPLAPHSLAQGSVLLGFKPVPASTADTFVVPPGYTAHPLISWGDPLLPNAPAFDPSGLQAAQAQALQFGDNTDGMSFFPLGSQRALLAVNNEYTNLDRLYAHDGSVISAEDALKAQYAHGVSIFEIAEESSGFWKVLQDSPYNRRLHARTPMEITGPAAGHVLLQTAADPSGRLVLGTIGNCANGKTPWDTYLTCEENFQDYFDSVFSDRDPSQITTAAQNRYGIPSDDKGSQWHLHDERFDYVKHPQEANRFGWIVEVDPHNPQDTPKKRTALGRFAHENAALTVTADGHVVVYMGDDSRGEHIYRFVSQQRINPLDDAHNRSLLVEGTLFAARFEAQPGELRGTGRWLALRHGENGLTASAGFDDQAQVLVHARLAASHVGATTMDRPEWIAIQPDSANVYCSLTNNRNRGILENQPVDGPNPRARNPYGQIIRWTPEGGDHLSERFVWDLFLIAGNPVVHPDTLLGGSGNVTVQNMFNGPDGLAFDKDGRLWIETDGDDSNSEGFAGMGNNQVLCADPASGEIRRFATGPLGCEMTGIAFNDECTTLFVGVQHPGEDGRESHFPAGGNSKPRSTIMMVRRDDGGVIGT